jgi:hypothetical protein
MAVNFPSVHIAVEFHLKHCYNPFRFFHFCGLPCSTMTGRFFLFPDKFKEPLAVDFDARTQNHNREAQL